jgi:hypothetical protein
MISLGEDELVLAGEAQPIRIAAVLNQDFFGRDK